jgi:hypothetical protein
MDERDATVPTIVAPLTFDAYIHKTDPAVEAIRRYKAKPNSGMLGDQKIPPYHNIFSDTPYLFVYCAGRR